MLSEIYAPSSSFLFLTHFYSASSSSCSSLGPSPRPPDSFGVNDRRDGLTEDGEDVHNFQVARRRLGEKRFRGTDCIKVNALERTKERTGE